MKLNLLFFIILIGKFSFNKSVEKIKLSNLNLSIVLLKKYKIGKTFFLIK